METNDEYLTPDQITELGPAIQASNERIRERQRNHKVKVVTHRVESATRNVNGFKSGKPSPSTIHQSKNWFTPASHNRAPPEYGIFDM